MNADSHIDKNTLANIRYAIEEGFVKPDESPADDGKPRPLETADPAIQAKFTEAVKDFAGTYVNRILDRNYGWTQIDNGMVMHAPLIKNTYLAGIAVIRHVDIDDGTMLPSGRAHIILADVRNAEPTDDGRRRLACLNTIRTFEEDALEINQHLETDIKAIIAEFEKPMAGPPSEPETKPKPKPKPKSKAARHA